MSDLLLSHFLLSHLEMPVVACYCSTFLAPEMLHVYRQITGLGEFEPLILTQKRLGADAFPFPEERIVELSRQPGIVREWRRFLYRRVKKSPMPCSGSELGQIERALTERKAKLLHIYFGHSGMHLLPLLQSASRRLPIVVSFHGADAGVDMDKPAWRMAMQEVLERADAILTRSESLASELKTLGCDPEKITIQRTGIPLNDWPIVERNVPEDLSWRIVQSGRLIEKKGHDTTLRAFAKLREVFPAAKLLFLGSGPLEDTLKSLANELGIGKATTFAGFVDQVRVRSEYDWAHLYVHPSRTAADGNQEGVPNSMLEAMATGLPVVATRHGGIPEAVEDGKSGFLVDEDDWEALGDRMIGLLDEEAKWRGMGTAARHAVVERFEQTRQIAVLENVYRNLINASGI